MKAGERRPDVALLGPIIRNPGGTIYESGRAFPGVLQAVCHAFLGPFAPGNRFTREYRQTSWDRSTEREVDWVSGAAMLIRRSAFEQVGAFDEAFWLYGEELDLCTRLRDAGWKVLASPELEVLHEGGVSTGRSRRTHLMHSRSIFLYYRKHRSRGWRRATLPLAWAALRARAELVALHDRVVVRREQDRAPMKAVVFVGPRGHGIGARMGLGFDRYRPGPLGVAGKEIVRWGTGEPDLLTEPWCTRRREKQAGGGAWHRQFLSWLAAYREGCVAIV